MLLPANRIKWRTACVLLLFFIDQSAGRDGGAASVSSASSRGSPAGSRGGERGVDRFVRAAPLIVGVKCSDGVLLLAAHTFDDDEPLLYFYPSGSDDDGNHDGDRDSGSISRDDSTTPSASSPTSSPARGGSSFRKLPSHYAGPFRIQVIDPSSCLAMASTGWRADCDDLVRAARMLAAHELSRYGPPSGGGGGGGIADAAADTDRRGTVLSCDLSLYLARCAVSEDARAKSCVGLLASPSRLWLVDATGATPVRALCVGGGTTLAAAEHAKPADSSSDAGTPRAVSEAVNRQLMQVPDWTQLDCRQALDELLRMLGDGPPDDSGETSGAGQPLVRVGTRVEVAFVRPSKVMRHKISE